MYEVFISVGKGKNKATMGSIPLSKEKVCNYIKRNPLVKSNTKIKVTNNNTKEVMIGTKSRLCNEFSGRLR